MRRAVVDVGSNSVLLCVAELAEGQWRTLFESSRVTGLGRGTKSTGLLSEPAMEETLAALRQAKMDAERFGVNEVTMAATMAARIATNTPDFLARAAAQGTRVEVLSGEDEAELGFRAVAHDPLFAEAQRISIIDPGGHSTELLTAERTLHQPAGALYASESWITRFKKSFPVGALGLREHPLTAESPGPRESFEALKHLDDLLDLDYGPGESGVAVALGATGTNLVCIRDRILEWDPGRVHGQVLEYEEISRAVAWLFGMTDAERAAIPGLEPGREKTIHIGALILERFLYAIKAESCVVSVRGWRHALLDREKSTT